MVELGVRGALPALSVGLYRGDMTSLVRNTGLAQPRRPSLPDRYSILYAGMTASIYNSHNSSF